MEEVTMSENLVPTAVQRVTEIVTPILADLRVQLYDCELSGGVLRITVDREGGVDLDTIALVSRLVSRELDHDDPVPGRYTLEVTSPGLERPLRRPDHFRAAVGATVAVRLAHPVDELRRLHGTLVAADDDTITVRLDGDPDRERTVAYTDVERARTVFVWGPSPKPGKRTKEHAAS
jgi:ribosome maturation factor RimP